MNLPMQRTSANAELTVVTNSAMSSVGIREFFPGSFGKPTLLTVADHILCPWKEE